VLERQNKIAPGRDGSTRFLNAWKCQCWLKIPHSAGRKFPHLVVVTVYSFSRLARK